MPPLKVLIVGGGITGPALAHWLSKLNCDITIIERFPNLRASGQQVYLGEQGLTCLRKMGIETTVRSKAVHEQGQKVIDQQGRLKAVFEHDKDPQGQQSSSSGVEIMRGDLVGILYDLTKDRCKYIFGTRLEQLEQHPNGVQVRFSSGQEENFDLVVGADGQSSRTRQQLLGPEAKNTFHSLGLYVSYFTVPKTPDDESYAVKLLLPRRRAVVTRVDNPSSMQVYLAVMDPKAELTHLNEALKAGDVQRQKEIYCDLFQDAGWQVPRFLDGLKNGAGSVNFYNQKVGQIKIHGSWSRGRVVLVGDAAYCPSPLSGAGTSLGLVGAYILAGQIAMQVPHLGSTSLGAKASAIEDAFISFEQILRPITERAQRLAPGAPGILFAETAWGVWLQNFISGIFSVLKIHKLLNRFMAPELGPGWCLPHYVELEESSGNISSS